LRIVRSKKLASLLVLAMLMTMVMVAPVQAADKALISSSFFIVEADDGQNAGDITIKADTDEIAELVDGGQTLYVTIELPDGVEWSTDPVVTDLSITGNLPPAAATLRGADESTVEFEVYAAPGEDVDVLVFDNPTLDIESDVSGDIKATVTLQAVEGGAILWTQSAETTIAKVGTGALTATAATSKKLGKAPLNDADGADITIKENQAAVLDAGDVITLSIETSGVTFEAAPGATGSGVVVGAGALDATKTIATYTVTTASSGIGGKVVFDLDNMLDVNPGVSGDIIIEVSSDNSALDDTELVVAVLGSGGFTVTVDDVDDFTGVPGQDSVDVGELKIDPTTTFNSGGSLEITLQNGTWDAAGVNVGDWTYGGMYNDDKSIWYSVTGASSATVTFVLPDVDLSASAPVGDIKITIGGTAGVEGEYVIGKVVAAATATAEKPVVEVNALDQPAGAITITEAKKSGFKNEGNLKLTLPNGIVFSSAPKVYVDGDEVTSIPVAAGGAGESTIEWANGDIATFSNAKIETIEIKDIKYDVDSRFAAKDIEVKISGRVLTGANGSTKTILTVANAVGEGSSAGSASFVVGSTTYVKNGVEYTMDVAPYISGDRTFMPVRYVANSLGISDSNILWDATAKTVTLIKGDKVVQLKIGSKSMLINGATITMDVAPEIKSDRTMLPLRFIANAFGATVTWDAATQTAGLSY